MWLHSVMVYIFTWQTKDLQLKRVDTKPCVLKHAHPATVVTPCKERIDWKKISMKNMFYLQTTMIVEINKYILLNNRI